MHETPKSWVLSHRTLWALHFTAADALKCMLFVLNSLLNSPTIYAEG